jgi:hypothetical protein
VVTAIVNLKGLWLNSYNDPGDALVLPLAPGWSEDDTVDGEVTTYAGGRTRLLTRAGRARTLTPAFRLLTGAQVAAVRARAGTLQWVRASTGGKWCGVFLDPSVTWTARSGALHLARVTFTLTEVTASEVV